jgi:hypothetical protein
LRPPRGAGSIREPDGSMSRGPAQVLPVTVRPLEVQILQALIARFSVRRLLTLLADRSR